ncbi:putative plastid-lipid-associated protein 13 [Hibiscus syriacus]|uniref:Plastid-lipid-associated protein 13 n=1 Tax=Hibiscus syriacus TaxID=106335 RepID=A0A6A3CV77_HIBSY|nr:putative plastid-lipid-associated protein 13 [Hibiscus syriacus]
MREGGCPVFLVWYPAPRVHDIYIQLCPRNTVKACPPNVLLSRHALVLGVFQWSSRVRRSRARPEHLQLNGRLAGRLCSPHLLRRFVQLSIPIMLQRPHLPLKLSSPSQHHKSKIFPSIASFKDAGGFEALVIGKVSLSGWSLELWFGSRSPAFSAARIIFETFPSTLAKLSKMDLHLKDRKARVTAHLKLLNSIESKFVLSTNASIEGPLRMKEKYVEGILESPSVVEEKIPEKLKGAYNQALTTIQQLPIPIKDAVTSGLSSSE